VNGVNSRPSSCFSKDVDSACLHARRRGGAVVFYALRFLLRFQLARLRPVSRQCRCSCPLSWSSVSAHFSPHSLSHRAVLLHFISPHIPLVVPGHEAMTSIRAAPSATKSMPSHSACPVILCRPLRLRLDRASPLTLSGATSSSGWPARGLRLFQACWSLERTFSRCPQGAPLPNIEFGDGEWCGA